MTELNKRLGSMDYDGLIADIYPKLVVSGGTIRKLAEAATHQAWHHSGKVQRHFRRWQTGGAGPPRPLATRC